MARLTIEIDGVKELQAALKKSEADVLAAVKKAVTSGAEVVRGEIERTAPKQSGKLKSGFVVKAGSKRKRGANAVVTIRDRSTEYAFYLEFGAPNRKRGGTLPARPFIRPAFTRKKAEAERIVEREVKQALGL